MDLMKILILTIVKLETLCTLQGYVLVYDISDRNSFHEIKDWIYDIYYVNHTTTM